LYEKAALKMLVKWNTSRKFGKLSESEEVVAKRQLFVFVDACK